MGYGVKVKRKLDRELLKLPPGVKKLFFLLVEDLKADGPYQPTWPNYSPLGSGKYHCHLSHKYVACWTWQKGTIEIEVYYAGSREKAPY
jgi:mRNA-degrading endonuclease RelE of RelBE toxin-antitoxin system